MTIKQPGQEAMNRLPNEPANEAKMSALEAAVPTVVEKTTLLGTGPENRRETALWILAFIAVIASLYLARTFIVPLLFGILVSYTLRPVVDWLERYRRPHAYSEALIGASLG